jgi:mRNA degradation ribonuclease J1/J2
MVSSGFIDIEGYGDISEETAQVVMKAINDCGDELLDRELITSKVKETASSFLLKETGRRPMIIPVVVGV